MPGNLDLGQRFKQFGFNGFDTLFTAIIWTELGVFVMATGRSKHQISIDYWLVISFSQPLRGEGNCHWFSKFVFRKISASVLGGCIFCPNGVQLFSF